MAISKEFNKSNAFDELAVIMNPGPDAKMSDTIKALQKAQDYLEKINDEAFQKGFDAGLEAAEKKVM